jgi:hypothetical protein
VYNNPSHLYPGLVELGGPGELLPAVDVWVVGLGEGGLQLLQLLLGKGGPVAPSAKFHKSQQNYTTFHKKSSTSHNIPQHFFSSQHSAALRNIPHIPHPLSLLVMQRSLCKGVEILPSKYVLTQICKEVQTVRKNYKYQ